jgi:hypothetical protein
MSNIVKTSQNPKILKLTILKYLEICQRQTGVNKPPLQDFKAQLPGSLQSLPANGDCERNIINIISSLIISTSNTSREHFLSYPHMLRLAMSMLFSYHSLWRTTQVLGRLCWAGTAMSPRSSHQRSENRWNCWCLDTMFAPWFKPFLLISVLAFYIFLSNIYIYDLYMYIDNIYNVKLG